MGIETIAKLDAARGYHYTTMKCYEKIAQEGLVPRTNLLIEMIPFDAGPILLELKLATKPGKEGNMTEQEKYQDTVKEFLNMPERGYVKVTKSLLEPRPTEWEENREFGGLFSSLFNSIFGFSPAMAMMECYLPGNYELALLSFPIREEMYIVDDAHLLRLGRQMARTSLGSSRKMRMLKRQIKRYAETKIPALEYKTGQHSVPTLCIEDIIHPNDITVEWIKPAREIEDLRFVSG